MGYSLEIIDPKTGSAFDLGATYDIRGSTYAVGGTRWAEIDVTFNYTPIIQRVLGCKLADLHGRDAQDTVKPLREAADKLSLFPCCDDYWHACEPNVRTTLLQLAALAEMCPGGRWDVSA